MKNPQKWSIKSVKPKNELGSEWTSKSVLKPIDNCYFSKLLAFQLHESYNELCEQAGETQFRLPHHIYRVKEGAVISPATMRHWSWQQAEGSAPRAVGVERVALVEQRSEGKNRLVATPGRPHSAMSASLTLSVALPSPHQTPPQIFLHPHFSKKTWQHEEQFMYSLNTAGINWIKTMSSAERSPPRPAIHVISII